MIVDPIRTRTFKLGESLDRFVFEHIKKVTDGSVIVVTSKIAALAAGRVVRIETKSQKDRIIKNESEDFVKTKWCYLTLKDGQWCANAGVDESNVEGGGLILLPKDSYEVAFRLRASLKKYYKLKRLGVLVTDSRVLPLRSGVTGVALGYAGFSGLRNYVGSKDLFGRKLKMTQTNIADSLATAAVLVMGEGSERQPLALIHDANIQFVERVNRNELRINPADDLYRPLFQNIKSKTKNRSKGGVK